MQLEHTIEIGESAGVTFDCWAALERSPEHQRPTVERRKLTDGPVGVGTRYLAVDRWPGRRVEFEMEITEFDPPSHMAARWSEPMRGEWHASFEPVGGSTRMSFRTIIEPSGVLGVLAPVMSRWAQRELRRGLGSFKQWVEEGGFREGGRIPPPFPGE